MTIDEAIKHCDEVAKKQEESIARYAEELKTPEYAEDVSRSCKECAEEHRQLAEWLKELQGRRKVMEKVKRGIVGMKMKQNSVNSDYYTGFISALSNVEGYIAICEEVEMKEVGKIDE